MKHVLIVCALAASLLPFPSHAGDDEVPVPVPELHAADASLPGAEPSAPAPEDKPVAPASTNAPAPAASSTNAPAKSVPAPPAPAKVYPPDTVFTVQLGAFHTRERAFALYWELSKKLSPLQVTAPSAKDKLYRVRFGSYPNYAEAKAAADKVKARGIACFVAALNQEGENITSPPGQN